MVKNRWTVFFSKKEDIKPHNMWMGKGVLTLNAKGKKLEMACFLWESKSSSKQLIPRDYWYIYNRFNTNEEHHWMWLHLLLLSNSTDQIEKKYKVRQNLKSLKFSKEFMHV